MPNMYACQRGTTPAAGWSIIFVLIVASMALCCVSVYARTEQFSSKSLSVMTQSTVLDVSDAVVVVRAEGAFRTEQTAAEVLVEEVERRTGIRWRVIPGPVDSSDFGVIIRLSAFDNLDAASAAGLLAEGYRITMIQYEPNGTVVSITGADGRGSLFGVGHFLRKMNWAPEHVTLPTDIEVKANPQYPIRGHELGYRPMNNTWDAWTPDQFEQYIRELAFFGANAVNNIPFPWDETNDLMPVDRREMNRRISDICDKYDFDYWVWTPADYDLSDPEIRAEAIRRSEDFYRNTPRLDEVLIPSADPGSNHPSLLIPFAEELAGLLHKYHPDAGMWIGMEGHIGEKGEYLFNYLRENRPDWLAGVTAGPLAHRPVELRKHVPAEYPIRQYPDLTHTVRCQYPVPWWDLTWEMTHGREASNPRPMDYAEIIRLQTPATIGFLSYSDGVHDDVNKVIWSALAWDLDGDTRDILVDYARVFFGPDVAEQAADGIRAFEWNWQGPVADNSGIIATLALWQELERTHPELGVNWRWNMALLRAYYDAYVYHRLRYERSLESESMAVLGTAQALGATPAMDEALGVLRRATSDYTHPELRDRVIELCQTLNEQIGLQTSVEKYGASGAERGAVLDFLDTPLNDRLWLEREFTAIREVTNEDARLARLETIWNWSDPGPGGYYDNVGQVGMMPHVVRAVGYASHPANARGIVPHFRSVDEWKLAWKVNLHWPAANLEYRNLNLEAQYQLKVTGIGKLVPLADGEMLSAERDSNEPGEFRIFQIPHRLTDDGRLEITWGDPDDRHLNWRQWSRVHEVWLIMQ
jgi:hypothetical protein